MKKRFIYLMGWITLLLFPIPTFLALYFIEDISIIDIFQFDRLNVFSVGVGIEFGVFYAFLALLFTQAEIFKKQSSRIDEMVKGMNLNFFDCLFLSICAGVGEELLFRSGVQFYLGPLLTSIIFVAVHGYLNPTKWRKSLYGLLVLPFILIISYGYYEFGLWFSISAHVAYDLVLFVVMSQKTTP